MTGVSDRTDDQGVRKTNLLLDSTLARVHIILFDNLIWSDVDFLVKTVETVL